MDPMAWGYFHMYPISSPVAPVGATISTLFPVRWPIKCVDGQICTKKLIYLPAASPFLEASKSMLIGSYGS